MTEHTIPIEQAIESRFENATTEELRSYLQHLGVDYSERDEQRVLRAKALSAVGLVEAGGSAVRRNTAATKVRANDSIVPPYNLSPNGLWGGRRHRIKLPRPEGTKFARAEPVTWNGKATYWVAYEQVEAVPEPIYQILIDRKKTRPVPTKTENSDGSVEITTRFEFADYPISYLGVDPLTADRAGSMTEWYQLRGPGWFKKRNTRELQTICSKLEIPLHKADVNKTSKSDAELIADVFVFLYGHYDVDDAEPMRKEA